MRRRHILFAKSVARMEDTILPDCVMLGELVVGCGLRGKAGKKVDGVFPGRPQSFQHQRRSVGIDRPGRAGMAQDGVTRGGTFHGEMDHCRESQAWTTALHAVVCPNVTRRTKDKIAQSKRVRADLLAITSEVTS